MSIRSSGAVKGKTGWSQSGTLVAGNTSKNVSLQVNFDQTAGYQDSSEDNTPPIIPTQDSVHTIQFGVGAATTLAVSQQTVQPSPTPPNPPLVGTVNLINGSTTITFNTEQSLLSLTAVVFSSQPNRVYQLASTIVNSLTATLSLPYNGPTASNAITSITALAPIAPSIPAAPGPPQPIDVIAIIQFTVQGNKIQRIISVGNGTSISGPGEAIQVLVIDNTTYSASLGYSYNVSIQVTPGVRPTVNQPAVLYWSYPPQPPTNPQNEAIEIIPGGNILVTVPPNAGIVSIAVSAVGHTALGVNITPDITIVQLASSIAISYNKLGPPGTFITLNSNCSQVQIINEDATNDALVSVNWGVDG